jgi:predicted  nucleic acid-binding Zn-ribbon protein
MTVTAIESLLDLQEVDGRIRELEIELKDLPRRRALEMARLSGVSADLKAAKAGQEYAMQRVKSFEADAQAHRERILQLRTTQAGLKTNREYQQYSVQIDLVNHELEVAENNQLAAMDNLPETQAHIDEVQARFDEQKSGVDQLCAEIDERLAVVKAELEAANAERVEKVKNVSDKQFLLYYERLRTKRWPVVVTLTHQGVCDGCHLVQPPSVSQMVDKNAAAAEKGQPQKVVGCTMCGRILYRG